MIVLLQVGSVMTDITDKTPANTIEIINSQVEGALGEFLSSDISLTLDNKDGTITRALLLNKTPLVEIYFNSVTPKNRIFRGYIQQETLRRTGKYQIEVLALSLMKHLERFDMANYYDSISGRPDEYIEGVFRGILGNESPYIDIQPYDLLQGIGGKHDWNWAGQTAITKNTLGNIPSEISPCGYNIWLQNGTQRLGIIALGGRIYYIDRKDGDIQLNGAEAFGVSKNISRIWYAPLISDDDPVNEINRYYLIGTDDEGIVNQIYIKKMGIDGELIDYYSMAINRNQYKIKPDSICIVPSDNATFTNGAGYRIHRIYAIGEKMWGVSEFKVLYIKANGGSFVWQDITLGAYQPVNHPVAITGRRQIGTNVLCIADTGKVWVLCGMPFRYYYSDTNYTDTGSIGIETDKTIKYIGCIDDVGMSQVYFVAGDMFFSLSYSPLTSPQRILRMSKIPAEYEIVSIHPRNDAGWTKTYAIVKHKEQLKFATLNFGNNSISFDFDLGGEISAEYSIPEKSEIDLIPPYSYRLRTHGLTRNSPLTIFYTAEKNGKAIFNIWNAQMVINPNYYRPEIQKGELSARDFITNVGNIFGCNCLVTGLKERFSDIYDFSDGVFNRFRIPPVRHSPIRIDIDAESHSEYRPIYEVEIYDGVKITAKNNEIITAGDVSVGKRIMSINNSEMTPAWARILADWIWNWYNNSRVFQVNIPFKDFGEQFVGRILGTVNLIYYGEPILCQIIGSSLRRASNTINLILKEIIGESMGMQSVNSGIGDSSGYESLIMKTGIDYMINPDIYRSVGHGEVMGFDGLGNREITLSNRLFPIHVPVEDKYIKKTINDEFYLEG